jgi:hypothetical protein
MHRHLLRTLVATAAFVFTSAAFAAPPANIVGSWTILVDQSYTTLDITAQGGAGAPGASKCRVILGNLGIAPVRGHYCPQSGRVHFLHNNLSSGATMRTFTGSVSQDASAAMHMAGTFNVLAVAFGDYGEYPFSANK